ncbi:MAG: DUF2059 domain-containing protein [Akkermansiaceae bacterium]|jgi:uncharacterized protein|nr:DUF2059 domain-containing protein [Akkermansiaceae bacterium]
MKSSIKTLLIAASLMVCAGALAATAQEEKSPAIRLLEVIDFAANARASADASFAPVVDQMRAQGLPDEAVVEIKTTANRLFNKAFGDPEIAGELAKIYEKSFTNEEMEELLKFYETPVGKKSLQSTPQIMQESGVVFQKYAAKIQPEFQAEMQAIIMKYQPAPAPAPSE